MQITEFEPDDIDTLAVIQQPCDRPKTADELLTLLTQPDVKTRVARLPKRLGGFIVWRETDSESRLLGVFVPESLQRTGIGSKLVSALKRRQQRQITASVEESDLAAQLFLRKNGFRAVALDRAKATIVFQWAASRDAKEG